MIARYVIPSMISLVMSLPARADVYVGSLSGTGSLSVDELVEASPGVWRVEITVVSETHVTFQITADQQDEIEYIKVRGRVDPGSSTASVAMMVTGEGSGAVVRLGEIEMLAPGAGWTKADLVVSAFVEKDSFGARGNIGVAGSSPGGRIEANRDTILRCDGNFTAEVEIIEGLIQTPYLDFVTSLEGDILNDITVEGGNLNAVLANEGQIGTSSDLISITADGSIGRIRAREGIWANIAVDGDIGRIETTGAGSDFNGSASGANLSEVVSGFADVEIVQDLSADLTFAGDVAADVKVGRSLMGDIDIDGDLVDQIFINWADDSGSWSGDIFVGATTLSPKGAYTQTGLGGGAVGLVPFDLHKQDCDPAYSGSTWPTTTSSTIEIDLVHYGPIAHDGAGKPFQVERVGGNHCTGSNGNCFEQAASDDTANWTLESISGRTMTVSGSLEEDHHYHIFPVRTGSNMLKCDELGAGAGDVPVVAFTYVIYREAP
ncbi:MAG: hypothetical protein ACF8R7_14560 [Phycisphaerales bacterium JB039]